MLPTIRTSHAASALAAVLLAATAGAQSFDENFDTYTVGPLEGNMNASGAVWKGWANSPTFLSQVSPTFSASAPHSAELVLGCDTVMEFDDMSGGNPYVSGRWLLSTDVYIPSAFIGQTYFIAMNSYDDAGVLLEWSVQVGFNGSTGQMECDCGASDNFIVPLIYDQWFTCTWDIDIDNDWVDYTYDTGGVNLSIGYAWSGGVFGGSSYASLSLNALDLYPDPGIVPEGSPIYLDNLSVVANGSSDPGFQYCDGKTASGNPCPCGNDNDGSNGLFAGCASSAGTGGAVLSASGAASIGADTLLLSVTGMEPTNSLMFFQAHNNLDGAGIFMGDGMRCAGGTLKRLKVGVADGTGAADTSPQVISVRSANLGDILAPGMTRRYQVWGRDTQGSPCGADSMTSNGYEITWLP